MKTVNKYKFVPSLLSCLGDHQMKWRGILLLHEYIWNQEKTQNLVLYPLPQYLEVKLRKFKDALQVLLSTVTQKWLTLLCLDGSLLRGETNFYLLRTTHTALYDTRLAELFNYGETSNYQESTLKSYIATGRHVSWNRNFLRSSLQVILQSAKWHQT